jgi:hypothetical protein
MARMVRRLHTKVTLHLQIVEMTEARFTASDHGRTDLLWTLERQAAARAAAWRGLAEAADEMAAGRHVFALRIIAELEIPGPPGKHAVQYRRSMTRVAHELDEMRRKHAEEVREWVQDLPKEFAGRVADCDRVVAEFFEDPITWQHINFRLLGQEAMERMWEAAEVAANALAGRAADEPGASAEDAAPGLSEGARDEDGPEAAGSEAEAGTEAGTGTEASAGPRGAVAVPGGPPTEVEMSAEPPTGVETSAEPMTDKDVTA